MNITEAKSERIATRVTPTQKELIAQAASLRGRSLTDFMVESAQVAAVNAIEEAQVIQLAQRHQQSLVAALGAPPVANEALKKAAESYDKAKISSL